MMAHGNWIAWGGLSLLAVGQQFRLYSLRRRTRQREELFQVVTENAADMIALVDMKGRRLYNSPAYKRVLGYSTAELEETSSFEQVHPEDRFAVMEAAREARATGVGKKLNYRMRHKDGSWRVLESLAGTIRDRQGEVAKLVIVSRDITERRRAEEQAKHNSLHDGLTGLPNRRLFLERLHDLFERARKGGGRRYALLFVDLDGFKHWNDSLGPALGDRVIVEMGRRLEFTLRELEASRREEEAAAGERDSAHAMEGGWSAILSRMGGDEFSVLLEGIVDGSVALRTGRRLLAAVAEPALVESREVRISASVGAALSATGHMRAEELLQEADVAMRRAKELGGSCCEIFHPTMQSSAATRLRLEGELVEAARQKQFRVYYQPILHLATRRPIAIEALLRWQHPEKGLISPRQFLVAAENSGLLISTGQWARGEACARLGEWGRESPAMKNLAMHVNVSAREFVAAHFLHDLRATLEATGVEASRLQVEITEQVEAADSRRVEEVLAELKALRVGVVLEDFGAGDCSLSGLQELAPHALKIAGSLINEMLLDRRASQRVELIILVARKLNLRVIAEGIESTRQLERLQELGCEAGQGFLFSAPMAAEATGEWLRREQEKGGSGARGTGAGAQ